MKSNAATQPPPNTSKALQIKAPIAVFKPHVLKSTTQVPRVQSMQGTLKASAGNARQVGAAKEEFERSRSNSSTTLMPSSNAHSQQSQTKPDVVEIIGTVSNKKTKTTMKIEAKAFGELNVLSRRYFLAYLSNTFTDEPVHSVFSGMKSDDSIYKEAKFCVQRSYKTWKAKVLKAALKWVQSWIKSARDGWATHTAHEIVDFCRDQE